MNKYNGFSGLVLIFANRIAKELNEWLKVAHPERKVYFFTFAYHFSIVPPVKKIAENGNFMIIFDTALLQGVAYARESDDLSPVVIKALGY